MILSMIAYLDSGIVVSLDSMRHSGISAAKPPAKAVEMKLNTFHLPYICFAEGTIITFSSGSGMSGSSGNIGLRTRL